MPAINDYQVISTSDPSKMQALVDALIATNWQPYGYPFITGANDSTQRINQAMVLGAPVLVGVNNHSTLTSVPTSGATVNIVPNGVLTAVALEPAGTLATLTLTAGNGTADGQHIVVSTSQTIAALTCSGANLSSTRALPTTLAAGSQFTLTWFAAANQWKRTL